MRSHVRDIDRRDAIPGNGKIFPACDLRAPPRLTRPFQAHPGATTFPSEVSVIARARPYSTGPSASRRHLFRLSRLSSWVRLAGDLVDSDPDARAKLTWIATLDRAGARKGLGCVTTREPMVLSRVSCRPLHLALFVTWAQSRTGEDCRPRTTWWPHTLLGSPIFLPCVSLEVLTTPNRRYYCRTSCSPFLSQRVPHQHQKW